MNRIRVGQIYIPSKAISKVQFKIIHVSDEFKIALAQSQDSTGASLYPPILYPFSFIENNWKLKAPIEIKVGQLWQWKKDSSRVIRILDEHRINYHGDEYRYVICYINLLKVYVVKESVIRELFEHKEG